MAIRKKGEGEIRQENVNTETKGMRGTERRWYREEDKGKIEEKGRDGEIRGVHVRGDEREKVRMGAQ